MLSCFEIFLCRWGSLWQFPAHRSSVFSYVMDSFFPPSTRTETADSNSDRESSTLLETVSGTRGLDGAHQNNVTNGRDGAVISDTPMDRVVVANSEHIIRFLEEFFAIGVCGRDFAALASGNLLDHIASVLSACAFTISTSVELQSVIEADTDSDSAKSMCSFDEQTGLSPIIECLRYFFNKTSNLHGIFSADIDSALKGLSPPRSTHTVMEIVCNRGGNAVTDRLSYGDMIWITEPLLAQPLLKTLLVAVALADDAHSEKQLGCDGSIKLSYDSVCFASLIQCAVRSISRAQQANLHPADIESSDFMCTNNCQKFVIDVISTVLEEMGLQKELCVSAQLVQSVLRSWIRNLSRFKYVLLRSRQSSGTIPNALFRLSRSWMQSPWDHLSEIFAAHELDSVFALATDASVQNSAGGIVGRWLSALAQQLFGGAKRARGEALCTPNVYSLLCSLQFDVQLPSLLALPPTYDALHHDVTAIENCDYPAVCLLCGAVLDAGNVEFLFWHMRCWMMYFVTFVRHMCMCRW